MQNMTIRNKLILVITITCVFTFTIAGAVLAAFQYLYARAEMVDNIQTQTKMIAFNSNIAVAFNDKQDAQEVLKAMEVEPTIQLACIHDRDQKVLAQFSRDDTPLSAELLTVADEDGYHFGKDYLMVSRGINLDGERIGTVTVWSSLEPLGQLFWRNVLTILVVLGLASLIGYLVAHRVQAFISNPILSLAKVAQEVSEEREYTTRAIKQGNDEVGILIDAFNQMLEQIHQRDLALVNANEQLEVRVQERTAELSHTNEQLTAEILQRKRAEQAQEALNEDLKQTVLALRRSNMELRDFTYVTAHDLKSPLRAIGTLTDWIASDYSEHFDPQGREHMALIKGRVSRMNELIDSILRYAEIGRSKRQCQCVDIHSLLRTVQKGLDCPGHIRIVLHEDLPQVMCDRILLGQVFKNLLTNAIRYMDKQEGCIEIGVIPRQDDWEFYVRDNGPGIDSRYHDKIFKMFQTLNPRDELESTGIGLAIVKKIVELYGGRVWVASEMGEGSTFYFTLPKENANVDRLPQLQH